MKKAEAFNPGAVLDRVVAGAEPACLLYNLANFKKGGQIIDKFAQGGSKQVINMLLQICIFEYTLCHIFANEYLYFLQISTRLKIS